jgi:hypothetical protein
MRSADDALVVMPWPFTAHGGIDLRTQRGDGRMKSGGLAAGLLGLLILGACPSALAASACTSWVHLDAGYKDTNLEDAGGRSECVRDVQAQTRQSGYTSSVNVDTLFFWFGDDVVTVRCMTRTLVALSSYDYKSRDACPLLNQVKNSLRHRS